MREELFSVKLPAGSKRAYFFDVKEHRNGDVYIQFSESYQKDEFSKPERIRIRINKEDFMKVKKGLNQCLDYVKDELNVDFY